MISRDSTDERALLASALAGRYEVEREIGRGGMATVYLARDVRHQRNVAIKVLHSDLGAVLGVDRFLSEIRVTASLQHPNVLPLFDSGEVSGCLYYVMPFVDGESLRAKLAREKQLPVDEAVRIAVGIANAAAHAHEHGVLHRDLKPENILIQSGEPVVADFGIALAMSNAAGVRLTQSGISLGTPQYMSPEQATGDRVIDVRSDVYALGAITYEMLVGEPPHTGSSSQAVIARLLTDPARRVRDSRPSVPEHVDDVVAAALEKLPADRLSSAKEFANALQGRVTLVSGPRAAARRSRTSTGMLAALGVVSVGAIVTGAGWWRASHSRPMPTISFTADPPPGMSFSVDAGQRVALSPDGKTVAFATSDRRLYLRRFDQVEPTLVPNANVQAPELHFSADGKSIAYWSAGPTTIAIGPRDSGATPTKLVPYTSFGYIVSYSSDLVYLFGGSFWSVPSRGGQPRRLVGIDSTVDAYWRGGTLLPDGKTVAFIAAPRSGASSAPGPSRIALVSLDGGQRTLLDLEANEVVGYADGVLLYRVNNASFPRGFFAVKFDPRRRRVLGNPVPVAPGHMAAFNAAAVADNGTLAYIQQDPRLAKLETIDASGNTVSELPEARRYVSAIPSPDGKRIALTIVEAPTADVWVYDLEARQLTRLTHDTSAGPFWLPDSKRVAFLGSDRGLLVRPVDGSSAAQPLIDAPELAKGIGGVTGSPDGKYVIVFTPKLPNPKVSPLTAFPLAGGAPIPLVPGANNPSTFSVSHNGRWLAYSSRATGRHEVFIHAFPGGTGDVQISSDDGEDPQWSPDDRTLYYRGDNGYQAVALDIGGAMPRVLTTQRLFPNRNLLERPILAWSVHPDGKHFLVVRPIGPGMKLITTTNAVAALRAKLEGK